MKLKIVSENNFPTAAGLASSAAGFAALVRAIANLYELKSTPTELSRIARQGSGSACRSLFGGYVAWSMGSASDGSDSFAYEVAPSSHWPDMRAIILVASAETKGVSSTSGMQQTVATSTLFKERISSTVPTRMGEMIKAIGAKNFEAFAELTMKDSNSFHATCADTFPPIFYMNDTSRAAVRVVEALNTKAGKMVAAYTFDAGPNAVIYYLAENEASVAGVIKSFVGEKEGWESARGKTVEAQDAGFVDEVARNAVKEGVSRVILTGVGEGPIQVEEHLVDEKGEAVALL
jgi:diphosphomevalonate decarboxylase